MWCRRPRATSPGSGFGDLLEASEDYDPKKPQRTSSNWLVKPSVWRGDAKSVERYQCGDDPVVDCRPRVELPRGLTPKSELFVACSPDALNDGGSPTDPRPLFVLLGYLGGSPPQIESVQLEGGVASINVYGAPLSSVVVTARSLGGHYLPAARSEKGVDEDVGNGSRPTEAVRLDLSPRCRQIEVRLPRTKVHARDRDSLVVSVHGAEVATDRCVDNLVGSDVIQVRVPPAPLGVGRIDVELQKEGGTAARFGGDYEGEWPKIPFSLEFNQVTFTWRPPKCIYPPDTCPAATLDGGTACAAERVGTACNYRCPGEYSEEAAVDLKFPVGVEFQKDDPRQTWRDTLAQNGQELSSYVPSDEVYLTASMRDWKVRVPDNEITHVEFFGEDGTARKYGVQNIDRLVLKVPGPTIRGTKGKCANVRFKPGGDRAYDELAGRVSDGTIDLSHPERGARILSFNVSLLIGGGPAWSGQAISPPLYFSGLGMFGVQLRPKRGRAKRLAFEFQAGGTLGSWGVITEEEAGTVPEEDPTQAGSPSRDPDPDADTTDDTPVETRIGWARVLFEPALVSSLHEVVQLGVGVGLGFSLPFRQRDVELTQARLNFIYSPKLDFRFRLRKWLRLVLQFRYMGGEPAFTISEDNRDPDRPTTRNETDSAFSFIVLAGLMFQF